MVILVYKEKVVVAIIAAAGSGKRMGAAVNKIWLPLAGKPVLEHTLETFQHSLIVDRIVLVVNPAESERFQGFLSEKSRGWRIPVNITAGGAERQDSVFNGLRFVTGELGIEPSRALVVIHDGARALITSEQLERAVAAAYTYQAAGIGVPVKDTIKQVDADGWIRHTPDRSSLWAIQTPQTFDLELLCRCYREVAGGGRLFSDDCGVVEACGYPVKMVMGSYENLKITTPEDLAMAEAILRRREDAGRARV